MSHKIEIAGGVAVALRYIIHAIEARKDWSPEQKRWIPLVCVGLGVIFAAAALVAGMPLDEAMIVGGGAPGAVIVNELLGARKPPPVPPAALVLVAVLSGCAPAWQVGASLVASAHVAVTGYQRFTHGARRSILAASGCASVPACDAALAPFEAKQAPVLACLEAMAPLVEGAALAADARDVKAAAVVVPQLAAKVPACVVEIEKAKR